MGGDTLHTRVSPARVHLSNKTLKTTRSGREGVVAAGYELIIHDNEDDLVQALCC